MKNMLSKICPVLLLMIVLFDAPTPEASAQDVDLGSVRLPRRTVIVHPLAYGKNGEGRSVGVCMPLEVTVGGAAAGRVRIGFFDSQIGGSGDMWQSAGWMAAVCAAQLTDFDPSTLQVSFDAQGNIDGPSAGALMTVAILAAVRGDEVRADATMTGTINPDGFVGPVGGISHKIEGAARVGKKLVLVPAGIIRDFDNNLGANVDLIAKGRSLGVEVKPVLDIYEAYKLMTGKDLPRPPRAPHPRASDRANDLVDERIAVWVGLVKRGYEKYKQLPEYVREDFPKEYVDVVAEMANSASKLKNEGQMAAAYDDLITAAIFTYYALENGRCLQCYEQSGYRGTIARLKNNEWLQRDIDQVASQLRTTRPVTMNQLTMYMAACDAFFEAVAFQKLAKSELASLPAVETDKSYERMFDAADWQILAWLDCKLATDAIELVKKYEGNPIPDDAPVIEMAQFYRSAANANLAAFDALILSEVAKARGTSSERVRSEFSSKDPYYALLTNAQTQVLPNMDVYFGDGPQVAYGQLAASLYLFRRSSMLIAKYYSLSAKLDEYMEVESVAREVTFGEWLTQSEDEARRNIALLSDNGVDITTCAQIYEIARVYRQRDLSDRLNALEMYFDLNVTARVLRRIAGLKVKE